MASTFVMPGNVFPLQVGGMTDSHVHEFISGVRISSPAPCETSVESVTFMFEVC